MSITAEAIYEKGVLRLTSPIDLPEASRVSIIIETRDDDDQWLKVSEENLMNTWDNEGDDVFNELLEK